MKPKTPRIDDAVSSVHAESTPSKPAKRSKGPKPPEFIYADYADRRWAFYGSLKAQRSNRPDLKPIKLKVVEA